MPRLLCTVDALFFVQVNALVFMQVSLFPCTIRITRQDLLLVILGPARHASSPQDRQHPFVPSLEVLIPANPGAEEGFGLVHTVEVGLVKFPSSSRIQFAPHPLRRVQTRSRNHRQLLE